MNSTTLKIIIIIALFVTLFSCNNKQQNSTNTTPSIETTASDGQHLNIPDKVEIVKDGKQIQLPGTHLFIAIPEGFTLMPEMIRLQKSDDVYFQFVESFGVSYYERKPDVVEAFDNLQNMGALPYYRKEFKLGDYDAFIIYGAESTPGLDQIALFFGDNDFSVMVACEMIRSDKKSRDQMVQAIQTIYVDKEAKVDYTPLSNFEIDLSGSRFKFNRHTSSIFQYTIDGKGDIMSDPFLDQIQVSSLPATTYEKKVEFAEDILSRYPRSGIGIKSEVARKEITINGMQGYEISFDGTYQDKPLKLYLLIVGDNKVTISYSAIIFNNDDLYKQAKVIAKTLKSKR